MSPEELETRIAAERARLADEEARESTLTANRIGPLEAGDDAELDRIEAAIDACRGAQLRTQERIELLKRRMEAAVQAAAEAEIEDAISRASRARELGERLIREEYAELAGKLGEVIGRLHAIDVLIDQENLRISRAGRECVPSPNAVRCIPRRSYKERQRKSVGIRDRLHPQFEQFRQLSADGNTAYLIGTDSPIPAYTEIEVEVDVFDSGDHPSPLWEVVVLPPAQPTPTPDFWRYNRRFAADPDPGLLQAVLAELQPPAATSRRQGRQATSASVPPNQKDSNA